MSLTALIAKHGHRVDVQRHADGQGVRGGVAATWAAGATALPCLAWPVDPASLDPKLLADQEVGALYYRVRFDAAIQLGTEHRLLLTGPEFAGVRYLHVLQPSRAYSYAGGQWIADCVERPSPA